MLCRRKPDVAGPANSTADWYGELSTVGEAEGDATAAAADGDSTTDAAGDGEATGLATAADGDGATDA